MTLIHKHKKKIALLLCALFLASLFISVAYLAKESNHKCIGDNCPICVQMQEVQKTISLIGTAILLAFLACAMAFIVSFGGFHFFTHIISTTLVSQNVRMNN